MQESPELERCAPELARLRRLYAILAQINHVMVRSQSRGQLLQDICEGVVAHGGISLAWVGWCDPMRKTVHRAASAGSPLEYLDTVNVNLAKGSEERALTACAIHERKPVIWNNLLAIPSSLPWYESARQVGLRSAAAFPILIGNLPEGALTVYSREPGFFEDKEIELFEKVTANIAFRLERMEEKIKWEADLAFEQDLLRALMDNSPDHIYFKDLDSQFIRCSEAMCGRFGSTTQEVIGKRDSDFFLDEHAKEALEDEQKIIRTGQPLIGKVEKEVWKQGEETWALTTKLPYRNKQGEIVGTLGISKDFTSIKKAESKLEEVHKQLLETSRLAGMAEVATSVLHNVGNVLNSVNISSSLVSDKIRNSKVLNLNKVAGLFQEHSADLPGFFANNPKAKQVPGYLADLARHLATEREELLRELSSLGSNIEHIKEIVSMQQSYARVSGVRELLPMSELIEDAIRLNAGAMQRHRVQVIREFDDVPLVLVDKHKVVQILVNLLQNAKHALNDIESEEKRIILRLQKNGADGVKILVIDNGSGIQPQHTNRIFEHGFTTRKDGHGFGLHSGALAAKDLGGKLTAQSDGPGRGATFCLELPCQPKDQSL